ncbi:unnamed protein product [Effrenium voratum]|uniref:PDZ domain-containing protein n=1 Tax=Effrenium voratum TaxID=2562239 RepID=A0AA36HKL5_9DINO|nr:unnamed protein product [Effrenium voratum]CAJ1370551.1 unnamed protein product [Effrenium voratum]CAJ1436383.1 unnamed protein product [Effrenium voratum]
MADEPEESRFVVVITKEQSASLGLDVTYRTWTKSGVFITKVFEDGLIASWNQKNDPSKRVSVGDFIYQVNQVSKDTVAMITELKTQKHLAIHVMKRFGKPIPPLQGGPEAGVKAHAQESRRSDVEALLQQLNGVTDEELAGLICVALEQRPHLRHVVLGR